MMNNHVTNLVPILKFDSDVQMTILIHVKLKILLVQPINILFMIHLVIVVAVSVMKAISSMPIMIVLLIPAVTQP